MKEGHADRYSKDPEWNEVFMAYGGYKKKSLYAWVNGPGDLLCAPNHDYEFLLGMKDEMQKKTKEQGQIRLIELKWKDTKFVLHLPPHSSDQIMMGGGHALGGFVPRSLDDIITEFKRIVSQQYASPVLYGKHKEATCSIVDDCAILEHGNVRCWVRKIPDEEAKPDGEFRTLKRNWSAHVTMIERWNDDYHDVLLGEFYSPNDAIETAFLAFIDFQMSERYLDDV